MTHLRLATAALLLSGAVGAQEPRAPLDDPRVLDAEIVERFDAGLPRVDIVVTLQPTPEIGAFRDWDDGPAASLHRGRVSALTRDVVEALPAAEFAETLALENLPAFAGRVTRAGLAALLADPRVATVELDRVVEASTAQGIGLMNGLSARGVFDGSRLSIAIVDTGIDYTHPALGGGGFPNAKVIGGWDFGDGDADPLDSNGHGTGAAGVAAGDVVPSGDYIGGVAPGARLYALKIVPGGGGSSSDAACVAAWDWCLTHKNDDPAHPILVVNTSFAGGMFAAPAATGFCAASAATLKAGGITLVASAGNDGYCAALASPAAATDVISVGAVYDANLGSKGWCVDQESCVANPSGGCSTGWSCTDPTTAADQVICYSNSATFLDVLAPSNASHVPDVGGGFQDFGGTSAASPYAAGAAALLIDAGRAANESLSPDDVLAALVSTGVPRTDTKSGITKPRVDIGAAFGTLGDVWVDFGYVGVEDGTVGRPFDTLAEGVAAAPAGGTVRVKAGATDPTPTSIAEHVLLRPWGGVVTVGP